MDKVGSKVMARVTLSTPISCHNHGCIAFNLIRCSILEKILPFAGPFILHCLVVVAVSEAKHVGRNGLGLALTRLRMYETPFPCSSFSSLSLS